MGYNVETTATQLWIDPANQMAAPVATLAGDLSAASIRRIALGVDTRINDSGALFSTLGGEFTLDNLIAATSLTEVGVAIPEPRVYAALAGIMALGLVLLRRRVR
ncbi:MAG: hypothetical protein LR015_08835 [Verrucomicrobia bacterium]|nr:hypothetical protein [Verrucomicrobiota bacterium]